MSNVTFPLPIRGYNAGLDVGDTPADSTGDMRNVRPIDSLERRMRLGQRPGLSKAFDQQVGANGPVVAMGTVTVVDYIGS